MNCKHAQMAFLLNFGLIPKPFSVQILKEKEEHLKIKKIQTRSKKKWRPKPPSDLNKELIEGMENLQSIEKMESAVTKASINSELKNENSKAMNLSNFETNFETNYKNNTPAIEQHFLNNIPSVKNIKIEHQLSDVFINTELNTQDTPKPQNTNGVIQKEVMVSELNSSSPKITCNCKSLQENLAVEDIKSIYEIEKLLYHQTYCKKNIAPKEHSFETCKNYQIKSSPTKLLIDKQEYDRIVKMNVLITRKLELLEELKNISSENSSPEEYKNRIFVKLRTSINKSNKENKIEEAKRPKKYRNNRKKYDKKSEKTKNLFKENNQTAQTNDESKGMKLEMQQWDFKVTDEEILHEMAKYNPNMARNYNAVEQTHARMKNNYASRLCRAKTRIAKRKMAEYVRNQIARQ